MVAEAEAPGTPGLHFEMFLHCLWVDMFPITLQKFRTLGTFGILVSRCDPAKVVFALLTSNCSSSTSLTLIDVTLEVILLIKKLPGF
jgi:hypothetical protein